MAGRPAGVAFLSPSLSLQKISRVTSLVGSFQKEFRETELETGMLWGGGALSEHRDDQAPRPSKDSLTRTS